jgi:hypothetical protein
MRANNNNSLFQDWSPQSKTRFEDENAAQVSSDSQFAVTARARASNTLSGALNLNNRSSSGS